MQDYSTAGMIDWLTLHLQGVFLSEDMHRKCQGLADRLLRISPTGELRWATNCRENIRSDTHQVTVTFGSRISIQGSPARIKFENNVFGSLDIQECALDMINFVCNFHNIILTRDLKKWSCSKIDVTQNFDLGSRSQCQQAVDSLKFSKYGRQKLSTFETSVQWGKGSTLQMLKAYMKGDQCLKLMREGTAFFTEEEIAKAHKLLRLEYSIRRVLIYRLRDNGLNWYDLTPDMLIHLHRMAFSPLISEIEITDMDNLLEKLLAQVGEGENQIPTKGQAAAAYNCYLLCKNIGVNQAKESFPSSSWHRHLKNLSTIGIKPVDLQPSNVIPFRRRPIVLDNPVSSWADIKLP